MVGTMNHSTGQGIEGRMEGGMISALIILPFSSHFCQGQRPPLTSAQPTLLWQPNWSP